MGSVGGQNLLNNDDFFSSFEKGQASILHRGGNRIIIVFLHGHNLVGVAIDYLWSIEWAFLINL